MENEEEIKQKEITEAEELTEGSQEEIVPMSEQIQDTEVTEGEPVKKSNKKAIISLVLALLAVGIGGAVYANSLKQAQPKEQAVTQEIEEKQAPEIVLFAEKFNVAVNEELLVRKDFIKEIRANDYIVEKVTITMKKESDAKILVTENEESNDKTTKNLIPALKMHFTKEGTYTVVVTVECKGGEVFTKEATFNVKQPLSALVEGLRDWKLDVRANNIDFMDGISFDDTVIKAVTVDSSKVVFGTVGTYSAIYHIEGINGEKESVDIIVEIMSEVDAILEADKGVAVITEGNRVTPDSKGNAPEVKYERPASTRPTTGGSSSNATSNTTNNTSSNNASGNTTSNTSSNSGSGNSGNNANTNTNTGSNNSNNSNSGSSNSGSNNTGNSGNQTGGSGSTGNNNTNNSNNSNTGSNNNTGGGTPPAAPKPPVHTHSWVQQYKNEDQGYWSGGDKVVTSPAYTVWVCGCGAEFTSVGALDSHHASFIVNEDFSHPGHHTSYVVPEQSYTTERVWVANIVQVPNGSKCSCGATK